MLIKAKMHGLRIIEVPTTLSPDGRDRAPHLRRYRDGWRSLRFYLLMSPRWFFGYPGAILFLGGLIASTILFQGAADHFFGYIRLSHLTLFSGSYLAGIPVALALRFREVNGSRDRLTSTANEILVS